jgi:hypothetical protein
LLMTLLRESSLMFVEVTERSVAGCRL